MRSCLDNGKVLMPRRFDLSVAFAHDLARFARRKGALTVLIALAAAFAEAISFALVAPMLALLAGASMPGGITGRLLDRAGVATPGARLSAVLGVIATLWILRCLLVWLRDVRMGTLAVDFAEGQRRQIVTRLVAAPWSQVALLDHARIGHSIGQDAMRTAVAAHVLVQALVAAAMLGALAAVALLIAPMVAGLTLAVLMATALGLGLVLRRAHEAGAVITRANLDLAQESARFLGGLRFAASQNLQADFAARFEVGLDAAQAQQGSYIRQQSVARLALSAITLALGALVVFLGRGRLDMPLPLLGALLLILSRLGGPLAHIQQALQQFFFALPGYTQLRAVADEIVPQPVLLRPMPSPLPEDHAALRLVGVSFAYPSRNNAGPTISVLQNANLTLAPGEMLGISGVSGAGKSTLADLMVGLVAPQEGQVKLGDLPIIGSVAASWREQIAYATQEPFFFRASLRENLAWGTRCPDDADIWAALDEAEAGHLVRALPDGLATIVGERGSLLSGGERQRLALARALLRGGRLLLLDESTSSVDVETEARIFLALRKRLSRCAILVISHRSEPLAFCDRVVRLSNCRIEPIG